MTEHSDLVAFPAAKDVNISKQIHLFMQELDRYPQQRVLALSLWMLSFLTSLTSALSQLSQPQFTFRSLYESVPVLREEQEETPSFLPGLLLQEGIVYTSIHLNNFPKQRVATWCEFIAAGATQFYLTHCPEALKLQGPISCSSCESFPNTHQSISLLPFQPFSMGLNCCRTPFWYSPTSGQHRPP